MLWEGGGQEVAPGVGFSSGGAAVSVWRDIAHPPPRNPPMVSVPFPQTKGDGPVQPGDTSTRCAPHGRAAPSGGGCRDPPCHPRTRVLLPLHPFKSPP